MRGHGKTPPKYRKHKASRQAIVVLNGMLTLRILLAFVSIWPLALSCGCRSTRLAKILIALNSTVAPPGLCSSC